MQRVLHFHKNAATFIILYTLSLSVSIAQTHQTKTDVFISNDLAFYGYDFTSFTMADPKRMDENVKSFLYVWYAFLEERITVKYLKKKLYKDNIQFYPEPMWDNNIKLSTSDLIYPTARKITTQDVQNKINKYQLEQTEGVGFVVIVECFDNANKTTSAYFNYFDIGSREILYQDYISNFNSNSYNRVTDWGAGLVIAFKKHLISFGLELDQTLYELQSND